MKEGSTPSKFAATVGATEAASVAAGSKKGEVVVESIESRSLEVEGVEKASAAANFEREDPSSTSPRLLPSDASMFTVATLHESLYQEASCPSLDPIACFVREHGKVGEFLEKLANFWKSWQIFNNFWLSV